MIDWVQSLDIGLFRLINISCSNRLFDWLMPFVSNSPLVICSVIFVAMVLAIKAGARGRVCVMMLILSMVIGNWLICDSIKHGVARLRPFHVVKGAKLVIGMGDSFSMPSSHSANWFSISMVFLVYYRRTVWALPPFAALVGLSRIYNGVHYPSDVLAGALLGSGYSAAIIWGADAVWQWIGPEWFPLWWEQMPSLLNPVVSGAKEPVPSSIKHAQWLRLGYVVIALLFALRLTYIGLSGVELSEDEAYQWLWSKHPALSYYSKPPMIAYTQWLGTHLWGDSEFGVRFFSPVIAAAMSVLVFRLMTREAGGRVAFMLLLIFTATPLLAIGSTILTVDPLSVLFWTAAMVAGWRAIQPDGTTRQWIWVGVWTGLGCMSKWTNLAQFACWIIFFLLWPAARQHLRRPGPYLALLVTVLFFLPVIIWLQQHQWITVEHVATDGQLEKPWTQTFTGRFLQEEAGALHPIFLAASIWAALAFWRQGRNDPFQLLLFSMGAPLFFGCFVLSLHSHIEPNWIAPSVVPMFCLMGIYWQKRQKDFGGLVRPLLAFGLVFGLLLVVVMQFPSLVTKALHRRLPPRYDLLRRAHGWKEMAGIVGKERQELAKDGPVPFIIAEHYGFTSQLTFYMPEAKREIGAEPLVYFYATKHPMNQFYYWPNYLDRTGQDALFVREISPPTLRHDWFSHWWHNDTNIYTLDPPKSGPPPAEVRSQFDSFTDLGVRDIIYKGDILRRVQLIQCHRLH